MEEIELQLNDFLFNSGILGIYRILQYKEKEQMMRKRGNTLIIQKDAFQDFTQDYVDTMIAYYEKDTKYAALTKIKEDLRTLDENVPEQKKIIDEKYKFIKKSMESASYKAGFEIIKKEATEDPYEKIELLKKETNEKTRKEYILAILEHLENHKEVYCMKDIIYTKINSFWENVAFLNRNANKNDIKEEYQKVFVTPFEDFIKQESKNNDYNCIQCGKPINKKEASGMSWLSDVGVDINRKKSGFWNFKESMFTCPICNLVYSCIPLGFNMIGSNGIFVNNNNSIQSIISDNNVATVEQEIEEEKFESIYQKVLTNFIQRTNQMGNKKSSHYEPKNVQVIKRIASKDKKEYEFNNLSKDKLEIIGKTINQFEHLIGSNLYQKVLTNLLEGRKQYSLMAENLRKEENLYYIKDILMIQLTSMGGMNVKDKQERVDEMIEEGEKLQKYFFANKENENKLKSYVYHLQNALKSKNVDEFMKFFTMFYGSLGKPMPNCEAVKVLIKEPEYFRLLGYSYIYGLQKRTEKKGGNKDEE